jgi:hypothetical protein
MIDDFTRHCSDGVPHDDAALKALGFDHARRITGTDMLAIFVARPRWRGI